MPKALLWGSLFLLVFASVAQAQEASPAETARDYVIGPGDLLSIVVYDAPDLSRDVRVTAKGFIQLPLLPEPIQADGRTPEELAEALAHEFQQRQILRNPQVTVLVKEFKSRPVAVLGAVKRPQMVPVFGPMNLLQVLSAAEGLTDDAGGRIYVTRGAGLRELPAAPGQVSEPENPGLRTVVVDVRDLMEMRNPAANVAVYAGDMVTVPRAGIIYVVGAVNKPGGFLLRDRRELVSVLQAVALAENMTGTARPGDAVIIRRPPGAEKEETIEIDVGRIMARRGPDTYLQENDILFIPDSAFKKGLRRAAEAAIQITTGVVIWHR